MEHELSRVSMTNPSRKAVQLMFYRVVDMTNVSLTELDDDIMTYIHRSLKAIGNPRDIAHLISSQKAEIRTLTDSLQTERANKQRDMSHAMKSMDCQLHASRNGALNERHQLGLEYETLKTDMSQQLERSERDRDEATQKLHAYYAAELNAKSDHYEVTLMRCCSSTLYPNFTNN